MNAKSQERTASALVILTGLWVAFSPLLLSMSQGAAWNAVVVGGVLALMGVGQLFLRSAIPSVVGIFLSAWFIIAAFVFDQSAAAMWSLVIAGVVGVVAAAWDAMAAVDAGGHNVAHPAT